MNADYRVIWNRRAGEIVLAEIVVGAFERGESTGAITEAVASIDRQLARNPNVVGESRSNFERVLMVPPLTVFFEVHDAERLVYVLRVRDSPPRRSES